MASRAQAPVHSGDSETTSIALGSNVTVANQVALVMRRSDTTAQSSVTDDLGNTFNFAYAIQPHASVRLEGWWANITTGGAATVTLGVAMRVAMVEITGLGAGAVADAVNTNSGNDAAPTVSATATAACYGVGGLALAGYPSVHVTAGSGWTLLIGSGGHKYEGEDQDFASSGAKTADWSLPESQLWAAGILLLRAAGGGGATRGTTFGNRGTAFNGGRTVHGPIASPERLLWLEARRLAHRDRELRRVA